jgi:hypothetical protein
MEIEKMETRTNAAIRHDSSSCSKRLQLKCLSLKSDMACSTAHNSRLLPNVTWDRCYDFKNIFAKKIAKKWRF